MFEFLDEYFDRVHTNLVRCLHCFGNKKSSPVHHSHSPVFFQNTISRLVPAKLVGLRMIHPNIFVHGDFQNSKMDLHYISNSISFSSNGKWCHYKTPRFQDILNIQKSKQRVEHIWWTGWIFWLGFPNARRNE